MSLLSTYREEGEAHATLLQEVTANAASGIFQILAANLSMIESVQTTTSNVVVLDTTIPGTLEFLFATRRNNSPANAVMKITLDGSVIYNYALSISDTIAHNPVGLFSIPITGGVAFSLGALDYNTLKVEVQTTGSAAACHTFYRLVEK